MGGRTLIDLAFITPEKLAADLQMDEPSDPALHVRLNRVCTAANVRVQAALRPVANDGDLTRGSEHWQSIEYCASTFARAEWFMGMAQSEQAQVFLADGRRQLDTLVKNLRANLGPREEPVVVGGGWDDTNILTPGQYRRGGAIVSALGGRRGRRARDEGW